MIIFNEMEREGTINEVPEYILELTEFELKEQGRILEFW